MEKFTTTQAESCKMIRCDSYLVDGAHKHFAFCAEDRTNNQTYEWQDNTLAGDATNMQKRAVLTKYIKTQDRRPKPIQRGYMPDLSGEIVGKQIKDIVNP